jgi:outer membrane protein TolC
MAKRARLAEAFANLQKTRASSGPKVWLSGRGGAAHAVHDKTDEGHYQIGLNFEMPVFKGFETMYKNRIAYADTQLSMEELAELELEISLEVLTASNIMHAASEMMPEAEIYLDSSLKAYESVISKYKAGKEGIAEVSNAQRQLAAARVRYSDIKTRWVVSIANLAFATGTLAPYMEKKCED